MAQHVTSSEKMDIYFDLEGKKINGGTLPADIVTTLARPDIVLIDRSTTPTTVYLYELTVAYESANSGANQRKENRYASLVSDIEKNGFTCVNVNFEIGTRGFIDNRNKCALARARSTPEDIQEQIQAVQLLQENLQDQSSLLIRNILGQE